MISKSFEYPPEVYQTVSPLKVLRLIARERPIRSVVDFGCGAGAWLAAARALGAEETVGVDGAWARGTGVEDACSLFVEADLESKVSLGRRFDLAICVEVAEHLMEERAETLIDTMVEHSNVVLFAAAIPGQGGADHLNEQWPEYWTTKFERRGYGCLDSIRSRVWNDTDIKWWYRQNTFLAIRGEVGAQVPSLVHPECYVAKVSDAHKWPSGELPMWRYFKGALARIRRVARRAVERGAE